LRVHATRNPVASDVTGQMAPAHGRRTPAVAATRNRRYGTAQWRHETHSTAARQRRHHGSGKGHRLSDRCPAVSQDAGNAGACRWPARHPPAAKLSPCRQARLDLARPLRTCTANETGPTANPTPEDLPGTRHPGYRTQSAAAGCRITDLVAPC